VICMFRNKFFVYILILLAAAFMVVSAVAQVSGTKDNISIRVKDADVRDILIMLADVTGKNIILDPQVKGKVTLNLKDVTFKQALDAILFFNDLGYIEFKSGGGVVAPYDRLKNVLNSSIPANKSTAETIILKIPMSFETAHQVWPSIRAMFSSDGKFQYDKVSRVARVVDYPEKAEEIMNFILMKIDIVKEKNVKDEE
jgi:type IV pilus assembly protein PilQ